MTPNTTKMQRLPRPDFQSFLAKTMQEYLVYLDHLGFSAMPQAHHLLRIDRFLVQHQIADLRELDIALMMCLVQEDKKRLRAATVRRCLQTFKQFCSYLVRLGRITHNPLQTFPCPRNQPHQPYVFSAQELERLFDHLKGHATEAKTPAAFYRAYSYYTLYHLLYACGLRISEAVALNLSDYSQQQASLFIRNSKFHKDRLIPISLKVCRNLNNLLNLRLHIPSSGSTNRLFVHWSRSKPYNPGSVGSHFRKMLRRLGIYHHRHYQQGVLHGTPHLHELRRAFAVHRLLRWYRQGVDINTKLPLLATYMGHCRFEYTKTYLTLTHQLLQEADQRFSSHFDHLDWIKDDSKLS